ncbi:hypothetical protein [Amycolatopsis sp. EV170708-02-1]|uniref:hypothetical protein n=1 Tax=Amycolatopsis sp. EV170708-02-1 TaxID=2919322 RepID=UPI001F0CDB11|nr:hypothetical protein [Amycolatopsis sp. EV170708-02-1]UMP06597.1 hypothetical protein MJQ72_18075 [Amycolatopsis sp. EV170708-02-1]
MRAKGIAYDTGFVRGGENSRENFDPDLVKRELAIIRDELHCTAVHLVGGDPERLELAANHAAELGLEVWFSPYPLELTTEEMLALFADCARRAERVRRTGAEVVFVTGVELTLMDHGFLPGDDITERLGRLFSRPESLGERTAEASERLNDFLGEAVATVRKHFHGKITYACIPFERVDWTLFDFMSVELIRSAEVADRFQEGVRALVAQGKPVAITGFGAATWRGAGDRAPRSMEIVEHDEAGRPVRLNGEYDRDEAGQAAYLRELLEIFDAEGVDGAFVYLFALYNYPHRPGDPRRDLDLASLGIVKVLEDRDGETYPGMPWEPKAAFTALADYYRS